MVTQRAKIPGCPPDPVCKGGAIQLDALAGINLRLPIERQMIGILGHQHLSDQGLGGNAAFDDTSRCRGLDDRTLTGAAAIARPTGNQNTERGWHNIKAFGYVLTDLVQSSATAWAGLIIYIDKLLDPFEMCGQRAAIGFAWAIALWAGRSSLTSGTGCAKCRLNILKAKLELVGIELLGLAAETVAREGVEDRLQSFYLCFRFTLRGCQIGSCRTFLSEQTGLLKRECA